VTFIYPYDYKASPNQIDLEALGVRVIGGATISQMILFMNNIKFDVVFEFLWFNPDYFAYLRSLVNSYSY
jgi:hypothetical protein